MAAFDVTVEDRAAVITLLKDWTAAAEAMTGGRTTGRTGAVDGPYDAPPEDTIRAAELANAHDFIVNMPHGYGTMVGERGVTLSGGQRRRIAIARAIVRNSPILILDEPTAGLDAASERAVVEALDRLMKGRTTLIIAHHLDTIRHADVIFVVKDAEVVETGTHETLLARGGVYARLYDIQTTGAT